MGGNECNNDINARTAHQYHIPVTFSGQIVGFCSFRVTIDLYMLLILLKGSFRVFDGFDIGNEFIWQMLKKSRKPVKKRDKKLPRLH